jgi:hypothetical protein
MRTSYEDEIVELEERLETEKDLLVEKLSNRKELSERPTRDVETVNTETKQNNINPNTNNKPATIHTTDILFPSTTTSSKSDDYPVRMRPERECAPMSQSFTLADLRDLFYLGDMKEFADSDYDEEKEYIQKSMREQYENKLRFETDFLMKRLLELSDELDNLKSNT